MPDGKSDQILPIGCDSSKMHHCVSPTCDKSLFVLVDLCCLHVFKYLREIAKYPLLANPESEKILLAIDHHH